LIRKSILFLGFRIELRFEILLKTDRQLNVIKSTNYGKNMKKNRAYITRLLFNLKTLKNSYAGILKDISEVINIENIKPEDPFLEFIELLTKEQKALPLGYRYTGPFYIKQFEQFTKYDGVLFMRENLVSWIIEQGTDRHDPCYHRNIFKEPKEGCELKKEDAELVFEQN
jgi:hypothetical protein